MRHAQHHFAGAAFACMADHLFEHRDQGVATLQRSASPREFGAEVALQTFRGGQFAEEAFFLFRGKARFASYRFNALLDQRFSSVEVICMYSAPMEPQ